MDNVVVDNELTGNAGYGLKALRSPQGRIAANTFAGDRRGTHEPPVVGRRPGPAAGLDYAVLPTAGSPIPSCIQSKPFGTSHVLQPSCPLSG